MASWVEEVGRETMGAKERKLHPKILFAIFLGCEHIKTECVALSSLFWMVSLLLSVCSGGDS